MMSDELPIVDQIPYRPMNSWFAVARSTEIGRDTPHAVRLDGREIVLLRNQAGEMRATDAICPRVDGWPWPCSGRDL